MLSKVLCFNSGGRGGRGGWGVGNHNFTKECSSCPIVDLYDKFVLFMSTSQL